MESDGQPPVGASPLGASLRGTGKPALRQWAKTRRAEAFPTQTDLARVSARLCEAVQSLPEWRAARHVLLYLSLPDEISVDDLTQSGGLTQPARGASEKQFYVPRCALKRQLAVHPYVPDCTPLVPGVWGLREPDPMRVPVTDPTVLDLAIIPALLLTPTGERLGYGGGYYDRFLPSLPPSCVTVGVLPPALIVERLPVDPWDAPVQKVVTLSE